MTWNKIKCQLLHANLSLFPMMYIFDKEGPFLSLPEHKKKGGFWDAGHVAHKRVAFPITKNKALL